LKAAVLHLIKPLGKRSYHEHFMRIIEKHFTWIFWL